MSDNKENIKKSTYYAESQKNYRQKVKQYNVKYSLKEEDLETVARIEKAIAESGKTANAWIQEAIREKLERDSM